MLTSRPLPVVAPVEADYGLRPVAYSVTKDNLAEMNIRGGFVDLIGLERMIESTKESLRTQDEPILPLMCAAHRGQALGPIYHSLVQICLRDENLCARTLSSDN